VSGHDKLSSKDEQPSFLIESEKRMLAVPPCLHGRPCRRRLV